jgi:dolichol-phosphate mannosyltransferase
VPSWNNSALAFILPTFNEALNIVSLLKELYELYPGASLIVVDDDSPDGTAKIVKELGDSLSGIVLIVRKDERGRGLAGKLGFQKALDLGVEVIIEMDADGSHDPKEVPSLLRALETCDVSIGSRYVTPGHDLRGSFLRRLLSWASIRFIGVLLGVPVKDPNSGFRAFRKEVLKGIGLDTLKAKGPEIVHEVLLKAYRKGVRIQEVPIHFRDRLAGRSKLTLKQLPRSFAFALYLRFAKQSCRS